MAKVKNRRIVRPVVVTGSSHFHSYTGNLGKGMYLPVVQTDHLPCQIGQEMPTLHLFAIVRQGSVIICRTGLFGYAQRL